MGKYVITKNDKVSANDEAPLEWANSTVDCCDFSLQDFYETCEPEPDTKVTLCVQEGDPLSAVYQVLSAGEVALLSGFRSHCKSSVAGTGVGVGVGVESFVVLVGGAGCPLVALLIEDTAVQSQQGEFVLRSQRRVGLYTSNVDSLPICLQLVSSGPVGSCGHLLTRRFFNPPGRDLQTTVCTVLIGCSNGCVYWLDGSEIGSSFSLTEGELGARLFHRFPTAIAALALPAAGVSHMLLEQGPATLLVVVETSGYCCGFAAKKQQGQSSAAKDVTSVPMDFEFILADIGDGSSPVTGQGSAHSLGNVWILDGALVYACGGKLLVAEFSPSLASNTTVDDCVPSYCSVDVVSTHRQCLPASAIAVAPIIGVSVVNTGATAPYMAVWRRCPSSVQAELFPTSAPMTSQGEAEGLSMVQRLRCAIIGTVATTEPGGGSRGNVGAGIDVGVGIGSRLVALQRMEGAISTLKRQVTARSVRLLQVVSLLEQLGLGKDRAVQLGSGEVDVATVLSLTVCTAVDCNGSSAVPMGTESSSGVVTVRLTSRRHETACALTGLALSCAWSCGEEALPASSHYASSECGSGGVLLVDANVHISEFPLQFRQVPLTAKPRCDGAEVVVLDDGCDEPPEPEAESAFEAIVTVAVDVRALLPHRLTLTLVLPRSETVGSEPLCIQLKEELFSVSVLAPIFFYRKRGSKALEKGGRNQGQMRKGGDYRVSLCTDGQPAAVKEAAAGMVARVSAALADSSPSSSAVDSLAIRPEDLISNSALGVPPPPLAAVPRCEEAPGLTFTSGSDGCTEGVGEIHYVESNNPALVALLHAEYTAAQCQSYILMRDGTDRSDEVTYRMDLNDYMLLPPPLQRRLTSSLQLLGKLAGQSSGFVMSLSQGKERVVKESTFSPRETERRDAMCEVNVPCSCIATPLAKSASNVQVGANTLQQLTDLYMCLRA